MYNNPMSRSLLFLGLLLIPHFAHAQYLSPEDVLLRDGAWDGYGKPEESDAPPAKPVITPLAVPATKDPGLHLSPSPDQGTNTPPQEEALDSVTQRLLQRLLHGNNAPQTPPVYEQPTEEPLHSGALHSGVDLTGSGPETVAAILVMIGAIGVTIWIGTRKKQWMAR